MNLDKRRKYFKYLERKKIHTSEMFYTNIIQNYSECFFSFLLHTEIKSRTLLQASGCLTLRDSYSH